MSNKVVIILAVITLAVIGYLIYKLYYNKSANYSPSPNQTFSLIPSTPPTTPYPSNTPTSSLTPSMSPNPTNTPTPSQSFIVNTYTVTNTNVLIPLLSEDFVISVKPYSDQVSVMAWFNIENDVNQHGDSLVLNSDPITITQETPIIYSDVLKTQNIPYEGYPYLVIAVAGSAEIKASFYV